MRTPRARGMTLLEVLVASAMLAVFFIGIFGVVFSTLRRRETIEERAIPYATGPVVLQRVVEDLQFFQTESYEASKDSFKASAEREEDLRVDFVTAVPSRDRVKVNDEWVRAAVNETGYRLRRSEEESDLYALYRREDLGVDGDPGEGGKYYKLCDRVRKFTIEFFDEDPGEPGSDAAAGEPDWDVKKDSKLPWGCRVTLILAGNPDVETDDDRPPPDHVFQAYVPFRSRFDKPDGAGGTNKPPGR